MNTISLKLAKRIYALEGVKGESLFYWTNGVLCDKSFKVVPESFSAYTSDELALKLPAQIPDGSEWPFSLTIHKEKREKCTLWFSFYDESEMFGADTLSESMGLLYQYLLSQGKLKQ